MQDEPSLKNNPLIIQSLKPIDEKNFSIQFFLRRLINFNSLISTFTGYDVLNPIKQKVVMNISKISQSEWDALPQADKDLLLLNFDYILELFDDLASYLTGSILADLTEDALTNKKTINLAKETITKAKSILTTQNIEAILEIVYQLSKAGLNIIANRNPDYQANINDITNTTRKNIKELKKRTDYLAVVCETDSGINYLDGFTTQATGDSNLEKAKCEPEVVEPKDRLTGVAGDIGHAKSDSNLGTLYKTKGKLAPSSALETDATARDFMTNFNKIDPNTLVGTPPQNQPLVFTGERKVYEMIKGFITNIRAVGGIPIRKYSTMPKNDPTASLDLYFPDISSYAIATVKFSEPPSIPTGLVPKTMFGKKKDDTVGIKFSMKYLYDNSIIPNDPSTQLNAARQNVKDLIATFDLQWHHVEDLDTFILVPGLVHYIARHAGAGSIIEKIQGTNKTAIDPQNRDDWQTFIGSPIIE